MRFRLYLISLLATFGLNHSAIADECLTIVSDPKSTRAVTLFSKNVKEVFDKAGICVNFVNKPIKRIQSDMMNGTIDGEFFRVKRYIEAMSAHVVPIPTPAVKTHGLIVTLKSSGFTPNGLKDIKGHRIGIMHGYKWHEILGQNMKKSVKSTKYKYLVRMLKAGRVQGFLTENFTLNRLIKAGLLKEENIHKSKSVIDLSAYILLSRKHQNLLDRLDNALKTVKANGGFALK